jgi:ABC-type bacteriocin/lantibiotic exporter with double-glycine peptidase domain
MSIFFQTLVKQKISYKPVVCFVLFMALVVSLASVVMTQLTGDMGQAAIDMDTSVIIHLLGILTGIMVIRMLASASSALFLGRFTGKAGYRFRDNFAKYFLQKPFKGFENTKSGEAISVLTNDLPDSVNLVSSGGLRMIGDFVTLFVTIGYMFFINWWLSLIFFASFPLLIMVQVIISFPIQKKSVKRSEARAIASALANDAFQNTEIVVVYSLEDRIEKQYRDSFKVWTDASKSLAKSDISLTIAGMTASISPYLVIIAISAHQAITGNLSIAEWIAFTSLAANAANWLMMLSQRQGDVRMSAAGAQRLIGYMGDEVEDIHIGSNLEKTRFDSSLIAVDVNNLNFAYSDDESDEEPALTLDNVSFQIPKGSKVAIVGGSGSGKSTVLKLLMGLYSPLGGDILVAGANTKDVSLKSLRETYAYVPQDSFLSPDSILENITGTSDAVDMPRLEKICKEAGVLEFIKALPEGFNSTLTESSGNVSGGQKQRIAIARALYCNAPIVLFDEATSALDPLTEAEILRCLGSISKEKTVIMVAHRLSSIDSCDIIIVMDAGKVVATGTHYELISSSNIYANLYKAS